MPPLRRLGLRARALPRVAAVAIAAVAVLALHVVDDSFLQPQPGTSAGDHVVSGFVPLALLALAAWCYPRIRAGAQATLAIFLGVFGLVMSVEAVYYARESGPAGDDYTGFLAIPAGVALLAV